MPHLHDLNPVQQKAVLETEGPLLVFAGAGSGKTRVLTYRIAHLIEEKGVHPWNILAVTFTNKAADEMRERVERLLGRSAQGTWISTFHSACVRILRRHIDRLGFQKNFVIMMRSGAPSQIGDEGVGPRLQNLPSQSVPGGDRASEA
jgi:DNA helicase-2/ATP-dependent DNA helicase PcrA